MSENVNGSGVYDTGLPFNIISLNSGIAVYGTIIKRPFQSSDPSAEDDEYDNNLQLNEHEKQI
jgi:hypothetical protein